ncbi:MAG: FAD-binding oxidoreductase [Gammaproteobacteria bacterium]
MSHEILETLRRALGPEQVQHGAEAGARYHVDFSHENACVPLAVLKPRTTDDVATILHTCNAQRQRVVVQGGLTGLAGGATPQPGELVLSLERLSGIEELDRTAHTLTVQAGTPLQAVQQAAADAGYVFPLDLGARGSCTIGGNIATNAGGNQVIRFGMMRNLVLGLEAVLADGTVVSSMNKMLKNNAGYDLKQLFIGSEGTLGVVTRAVLRLYPQLPSRITALCALRSFDATVDLLRSLQTGLGGALSAFEAMWASYFHYVLSHAPGVQSAFDREYPLYALIELEGTHEGADRARLESVLEAAFDADVIADAAIAQSLREAQSFWKIRDSIGEVTPTLQPMLAFDVSLPIDAMADFLARLDAEFARWPEPVTNLVFGHIGDNNLHLAVTTHRDDGLERLCDAVYSAVGAHGGSISAEHGVGTLRRQYLHHSRNAAELDLMRRLKAALDPHGILNAARVLPE